ncbi:aminotransferase class IV [Roseivirga sp. E12]|uniref:aminotransferase class IV n=1 Tax=Roseivirga sp. E12 TaxID=2819237 RepID=UPI001ABCAA16|nr:aminotransferase class IV [Roseivirga sp. E12]MBO3698425.1 aminotransferase class IV [Roseivirga sp. E12]
MKAIFNSRIIETSDYLIKTSNRSFCYGDGLFETIVTGAKRINLVEKHLLRLKRGCKVLGIDFPLSLELDSFTKMVKELQDLNGIYGDIRTKVVLWRDTGGLYTPELSNSSFFIEIKPVKAPIFEDIEKTGFSKKIHTHYSPISFAKTTNALIYVLAGLEKNTRQLGEIILTDVHGHLSETHIANLFWIKGDSVFTPSLSCGCIEGIMRNALIELFLKSHIKFQEVSETKETLVNADSVFSTNASGIKYFKTIDTLTYGSPEELLDPIIKQLQQP